jgi:hypothetical protein
MESERSLQLLGTLRERGWQRSIRMRAAVDQQGVALPWFSYPAIDWLAVRIRATDRVFEWGSGSSTLWFSRHAASVVTVEHDPAFADRLHRERPANVTLLQRPAMGEDASEVGSPYASAIVECEPPFDIIVVDGKERNACIEQAIPALAEDGIIVVDNSDRAAYSPGLATLAGAGLWRVDFVGMVPGFGHETTTSMFGRRLDRWLDPRIVLADLGY